MRLFKKNKQEKDREKPESWPDHVVTLDQDNFKDFIEKYPLSVVDFWADWCKPCKKLSPRIRKISRDYVGKVAFGKINTVQNRDLAMEYKITSIPHVMFFHYGNKVGGFTGLSTVGEIKKDIDELLKKYG